MIPFNPAVLEDMPPEGAVIEPELLKEEPPKPWVTEEGLRVPVAGALPPNGLLVPAEGVALLEIRVGEKEELALEWRGFPLVERLKGSMKSLGGVTAGCRREVLVWAGGASGWEGPVEKSSSPSKSVAPLCARCCGSCGTCSDALVFSAAAESNSVVC